MPHSLLWAAAHGVRVCIYTMHTYTHTYICGDCGGFLRGCSVIGILKFILGFDFAADSERCNTKVCTIRWCCWSAAALCWFVFVLECVVLSGFLGGAAPVSLFPCSTHAFCLVLLRFKVHKLAV